MLWPKSGSDHHAHGNDRRAYCCDDDIHLWIFRKADGQQNSDREHNEVVADKTHDRILRLHTDNTSRHAGGDIADDKWQHRDALREISEQQHHKGVHEKAVDDTAAEHSIIL